MGCFISCAFWFAITLIVLKLWIKLTTGWCRNNVCLIGKTVIVTGGNSGIGYEAAADFAKRGAKVILACRDQNRGENAKEKIIKDTDNKNIIFKKLDLSALKSVRQFAEDINKSEESFPKQDDLAKQWIIACRRYKINLTIDKLERNPERQYLRSRSTLKTYAIDNKLDILVNNAGVGSLGPKQTEDGLLMLMQVNYFGHFLLTNLLLDLLKRTPGSRVVNVSSVIAKHAGLLDVNNLNQSVPEGFEETKVYARSKLCNILFTVELAERLKGTSVTVYSLHPGVVLTNIFRRMPAFMKYTTESILGAFFKNAQEGAQTTIYCSVEKGIEQLSGHHFHDCRVVKNYQTAEQPDLPRKLWDMSEKAVNLNQKLK